MDNLEELRRFALDQAIKSSYNGEKAEYIIARAELFLSYLKGEYTGK